MFLVFFFPLSGEISPIKKKGYECQPSLNEKKERGLILIPSHVLIFANFECWVVI
jgi:hypothetical protein